MWKIRFLWEASRLHHRRLRRRGQFRTVCAIQGQSQRKNKSIISWKRRPLSTSWTQAIVLYSSRPPLAERKRRRIWGIFGKHQLREAFNHEVMMMMWMYMDDVWSVCGGKLLTQKDQSILELAERVEGFIWLRSHIMPSSLLLRTALVLLHLAAKVVNALVFVLHLWFKISQAGLLDLAIPVQSEQLSLEL